MKAVHFQPSAKQCFSSILTNVCAQTYMANFAWPPINVVCVGRKRKFQRQILWYILLYGKVYVLFFYSSLSLQETQTSILQLDLLYKYVYYSCLEKQTHFFFFRVLQLIFHFPFVYLRLQKMFHFAIESKCLYALSITDFILTSLT